MSSDFSEENKKMREQLRQGIAEAEDSVRKSKEYLERKGYALDSPALETMLSHSSDPKVKQKYTEHQEELQREIEQERSRLRQLHSGGSSDGSPPRRKPTGGIKI